jgi:hypothetical protein
MQDRFMTKVFALCYHLSQVQNEFWVLYIVLQCISAFQTSILAMEDSLAKYPDSQLLKYITMFCRILIFKFTNDIPVNAIMTLFPYVLLATTLLSILFSHKFELKKNKTVLKVVCIAILIGCNILLTPVCFHAMDVYDCSYLKSIICKSPQHYILIVFNSISLLIAVFLQISVELLFILKSSYCDILTDNKNIYETIFRCILRMAVPALLLFYKNRKGFEHIGIIGKVIH